MGGPRRLYHGKEKTENQKATRKKLYFGVLLTVPLLCSCTPAQALPTHPPKTPSVEIEKEPVQQEGCGPDIRGWMEPGEKIIESICRTKYNFVLTNANLYIVTKRKKAGREKVTLLSSCSITDMRKILSKGYVDWTASEDTAFLLTRGGKLTLIPAAKMGDTLPTYRVPFNVENAKMTFHSGKLFIAGDRQLMVVTFSGKVKSKVHLFFLETKNRDFFESEGKLFFGNQEEKIEVR